MSHLVRFALVALLLGVVASGGLAQDPLSILVQDPADIDPAAPTPATDVVGGDEATKAVDDLTTPVKIVLLLTILTIAPAILMTVTSFTRIIIVLSFVRKALSVQEMPPNQVMVGLALFLTLVVMNPIITDINDDAFQPYLEKKIDLPKAADIASARLSTFLLSQAQEQDLVLMVDMTGIEKPENPQDIPLHALVPAFALSELRTAFQMGFIIYLPFLIVDLVVSSVLLSMGMFMLPPVIISTPFKILLFILVDGWDLVVRSVVQSFAS